jgi:hypothetical protein
VPAGLAILALLVLTAHVAPTGQKAVSMWMLEQQLLLLGDGSPRRVVSFMWRLGLWLHHLGRGVLMAESARMTMQSLWLTVKGPLRAVPKTGFTVLMTVLSWQWVHQKAGLL